MSVTCERCGYDLRGTGAGACPECGAVPGVERARRAAAVADRRWLACVTLGLALLMLGSFFALGMLLRGDLRGGEFYGPIGRYSQAATAVAVPGPRVWGTGLIQRSIGNAPGPLGTRGTLAAVATFAGLMLLTVRHAGERRGRTLTLARWLVAVTFGATLGTFIADDGIDYYGSFDDLRVRVPAVLLLVDLPAAVLTLVLAGRVAGRLRDHAGRANARRLAWATGLLMLAFGVLTTVWSGTPIARYWRYGGGTREIDLAGQSAAWALSAAGGVLGVLAWVLVGGLLVRLLAAWPWAGLVRRLTGAARGGLAPAVARRVGIGLLLVTTVLLYGAALRLNFRHGLGGNAAIVGWLGPGVSVAGLIGDFPNAWRWDTPAVGPAALLQAAAVWLMTTPAGPDERRSVRRLAARWWAVGGLGAVLAMRLVPSPLPAVSDATAWAVQFTVLYTLPATVLLYAWAGRSRRGLSVVAALAGFMIAAPLLTLVLSARLRGWWDSPWVTAGAAAWGAAGALVAVWATAGLVAWAWAGYSEPAETSGTR